MKVTIIYFEKPQWTEEQLANCFKKKGIKTDLIEAKDLDPDKLEKDIFLLNKVYASTANENSFNFQSFIKKLRKIEKKGIKVINSSFTSRCDYDKHFAYKVMKKKGVLTPKTEKISNVKEIKEFFLETKTSIIFKPNTGGRGASIYKIDSVDKIPKNLFNTEKTKSQEFIIQTLEKSIIPIDYRVFVYKEKVLFVNTRTLVDGWLGSRSQGSKISLLKEMPEELKKIAIKATKAIGAEMNSIDIIKTKNGYCIIENNPTPNFSQSYIDSFGFNPIKLLVEELIKENIESPVTK